MGSRSDETWVEPCRVGVRMAFLSSQILWPGLWLIASFWKYQRSLWLVNKIIYVHGITHSEPGKGWFLGKDVPRRLGEHVRVGDSAPLFLGFLKEPGQCQEVWEPPFQGGICFITSQKKGRLILFFIIIKLVYINIDEHFSLIETFYQFYSYTHTHTHIYIYINRYKWEEFYYNNALHFGRLILKQLSQWHRIETYGSIHH